MAISVTFRTPEGTDYDVELEPDQKLHLADGRVIYAEDLEVGAEMIYDDDDSSRGDIAVKVMGDEQP
jgi:hypothetical protein